MTSTDGPTAEQEAGSDSVGRLAYQAHFRDGGGKGISGEELPPWDGLDPESQEWWHKTGEQNQRRDRLAAEHGMPEHISPHQALVMARTALPVTAQDIHASIYRDQAAADAWMEANRVYHGHPELARVPLPDGRIVGILDLRPAFVSARREHPEPEMASDSRKDGLRQRPGDQPLPVPNELPDVQSMVIADIEARRQLGIKRYGTGTRHGHVHPRADGVKTRCGGPSMCSDCACERMETGRPVLTGLRLAQNCENWDVFPDTRRGDPERNETEGQTYFARLEQHRSGFQLPVARLRRIGWLDQRGRVWLKVPDGATADQYRCGSFTSLLIDPGERDGT